MLRRLFLIAALAPLYALADAPATTSVPTTKVTGEHTTIEQDSGDVIFTGNAILDDPSLYLTADLIRFNKQNRIATAEGHVTMTRGEQRLLADSAVLFMATGSFTARHLRAGLFPYYIEGSYAEGNKSELTIHDAIVSFREPGAWQPTVKAATVIYSPHHYLRMIGAHIGVGEAQPVPVVHVREDLSQPEALSYYTGTLGYRGSLGGIIDGALLYPVAPDFKAGADLSLFTNRGIMVGPGMEYGDDDEDYPENGYIKTGYIHDYGHRLTDILGNPVPADRAYAEWRHSQQLTDNITIDGELNWWKDSEVIRDFRPTDFFKVQTPDNFIESVYTGEDVMVSGFVRYQANYYDDVQERLPEFRFDLPATPLLFGIDEKFFSSIVALDDRVPGEPDLKSVRFDAFYGLERNFALTPYLDITPVVGARITHYSDTVGASLPGDPTRILGEVGADANLRASGIFEYKNPTWDIDGIRHLITPTLSWRYIPDADKDNLYIPQIDRQTFSTDLPMMDLGDMRNIDELRAENVLRVGINNTFQTRDKEYGSRDLMTIYLGQDFRFIQAPGQRDPSDLHLEVNVMPAKWIDLSLNDNYSVRPWTVREFDTDMTIHDADAWSIRFGTGFLNDHADDWVAEGLPGPLLEGLDNYHFETKVKVNEKYSVFNQLDYDFRAHEFVDQQYGVEEVVSNTWRLRYMVTLYSGQRRESHFGFNVQVDTVRF